MIRFHMMHFTHDYVSYMCFKIHIHRSLLSAEVVFINDYISALLAVYLHVVLFGGACRLLAGHMARWCVTNNLVCIQKCGKIFGYFLILFTSTCRIGKPYCFYLVCLLQWQL
ncbi:hypothetical protein KP509_1Z304600 [Ceratopteris richardii]|nr:hypothetical protein KP509_1Z304600 [Ceratopteris richardii]